MSSTIARLLPVLAVLSLVAPGAAGDDPPGRTAPAEGHREQPGDPPVAPLSPAVALAPPATVVRGNLVSVQVNTAAGMNIVGDAANEPSMAVDPTDPSNIVIGWRQFDSVVSNFRQAGVAYSHDGGVTWTFPGVLQPGQFRSDPVLGSDRDGNFYYYSLSTATSAEMFVSTDKGVSWLGPFAGFGGDKEWMTVDVSGSPGAGNLHALWNSQFTCCAPGTDYTRSIDGGFIYQGPYAMPVKVKWGTLDVGPDGTLWVVGADLNTNATPAHYVLRATNAFNPTQVPAFEMFTGIDLGGTTTFNGIPNPGGLLGQVWIAVDRSEDGYPGYVYVLGSVDPPGVDPSDVKIISSTNRGLTWTAPRKVNDEPVDGLAFQWFGALSLAPSGRIDVTWYDTRSDPSGQISEVYYAYSNDAGTTWSAGLPVSPPFNSLLGWPNQNKIGDYTHMVSDASGAALAYAATFNGEQDVWFVRVGDCNGNGIHDSQDIFAGTSADCNGSGHPDECEELREICSGGVDDDCDGQIDCADVDCVGTPYCACDADGVCEAGEDCHSCPFDCPGLPSYCGDGVCDVRGGEGCLSCPEDCNGVQQGTPSNQFCCGTEGVNPVSCLDPRCNQSGFVCIKNYLPPCCGDGECQPGETPCACGLDCGTATTAESACADGIDNDCDGVIDCADAECAVPLPAPPAGSPVLLAESTPTGVRLTWTGPSGTTGYDVVQGDLDLLASGAGLGASTIDCVADDLDLAETLVPADAGSRWFLVRAVACAGPGSYDSGSPGQAASRDAPIGASGGCP